MTSISLPYIVNCSQNGQLGLYQNQCTFQKIHSLSTGGAHSRVLAHIASPTSPPYVGTQLTALLHTQPLLKCSDFVSPQVQSTSSVHQSSPVQ